MNPQALLSEPKPDRRQRYYLDVFGICSGFRENGDYGPKKLTLSDLNAYFSIYNVKGVTRRDDILKRVKILDSHYMAYIAEKSQDQNPEG